MASFGKVTWDCPDDCWICTKDEVGEDTPFEEGDD